MARRLGEPCLPRPVPHALDAPPLAGAQPEGVRDLPQVSERRHAPQDVPWPLRASTHSGE